MKNAYKILIKQPRGRFNVEYVGVDFLLFTFWLPMEHGASMKLPVSLQFLNLGYSVGLLG
jgi:hypothetical protein